MNRYFVHSGHEHYEALCSAVGHELERFVWGGYWWLPVRGYQTWSFERLGEADMPDDAPAQEHVEETQETVKKSEKAPSKSKRR